MAQSNPTLAALRRLVTWKGLVVSDEMETTQAQQSRATVADRGYITSMILVCGLFAAAFAMYILYPAVRTVLGI